MPIVSKRFCLPVAFAGVLAGCGDESALDPPPTPPTTCPAPSRRVADRCIEPGVADDGCPAGTLGLEDGSCRPAGIGAGECGEGFEHDGDVGCEPIVPLTPCPKGRMAVPGERACRAVIPCGQGKWGDIPVEPSTVYVDGAYAGGDSDGSAAKPWTTVGAGVLDAAPGAIVAIAKGIYPEAVQLQSGRRVWGVCPDEVEITGGIVAVDKDAVELRGLAIRGEEEGIELWNLEDALLENVWVHDTGDVGFEVVGSRGVVLSNVLVERAVAVGVLVVGSDATIAGSVIRDTVPRSDERAGMGMSLEMHPQSGERVRASVRGSLLERNYDLGMLVSGSDASVEATVIRDTFPSAADGIFGHHILVQPSGVERGGLSVRTSLFERGHLSGVRVQGSDATLETTVIRDTLPQARNGQGGEGIMVARAPPMGEPSIVDARALLIERNHRGGFVVQGSAASVQGMVVRDTFRQVSDDVLGCGIYLQNDQPTDAPARAAVRGSLVERSRNSGVLVAGSEIDLEATVVRDTAAPEDEEGGYGISIKTMK